MSAPSPFGERLERGGGVCYFEAMGIRHWIFDLDNTLYPPSSGLFDAIDCRIDLYLEHFFEIPKDEAGAVRRGYFEKYGLTLIGLMKERNADPDHYLEFVHRVPVERYLAPDRRLQNLLRAIPANKAIFTNGSREHSLAVMRALGVSDSFGEVFDITSFGFVPKPDPRPYRWLLDCLGLEGPEAVLVEDLERNLPPAKRLGMKTVLVGNGRNCLSADYSLDSLGRLAEILPAFSS